MCQRFHTFRHVRNDKRRSRADDRLERALAIEGTTKPNRGQWSLHPATGHEDNHARSQHPMLPYRKKMSEKKRRSLSDEENMTKQSHSHVMLTC